MDGDIAAKCIFVSMQTLQSERLELRPVALADAPFIHTLMNTPGWLKYIGDRDIHSDEAAAEYLAKAALTMQEHFGLGMFVMRLHQSERPLGIISLLKRGYLNHADIGFALLPEFEGQGYAREGTARGMRYAYEELRLETLLAVANPVNQRSIHLLQMLDFVDAGTVQPPGSAEDLALLQHHRAT